MPWHERQLTLAAIETIRALSSPVTCLDLFGSCIGAQLGNRNLLVIDRDSERAMIADSMSRTSCLGDSWEERGREPLGCCRPGDATTRAALISAIWPRVFSISSIGMLDKPWSTESPLLRLLLRITQAVYAATMCGLALGIE